LHFLAKQIAPPKEWAQFEDLCLALFKEVWKDPLAQKNGRKGQAQRGVDVYGLKGGDPRALWGVQCKGKDASYGGKPTRAELEGELTKAEGFKPTLAGWVFATTAPTDGALQEAAREISQERARSGGFPVFVLGWEEIQALLATAPKVIASFYPEHSNKLESVVEALEELPSRDESLRLTRLMEEVHSALVTGRGRPSAAGHWQRIKVGSGRDLGPALMGRRLGPEDAAACPRLDEADVVLSQLSMAYSARIIGEPGAGKSVCAYQAALTLARVGHDVMRLTDPRSEVVFPESRVQRTLFLVDDAHLMPAYVLNALEAAANPQRLLLSVHNAVKGADGARGAVVLDASRAVKTIASALKADLPRTLKAVRRADDRVGERMLDEDVGDRIDQAARGARVPWQFCFVLGGGWRRSRQAAANTRAAGADLVLAAVAAKQLASRDARTPLAEIVELGVLEGIPEREVENALDWLVSERLIIGKADCRCPHQRFADVVLNEILGMQDGDGRQRIGRVLDYVLTGATHPLAGIRLLLHALRFGRYQWSSLISVATVRSVAERCWKVTSGEGRLFGALVLSELSGFSRSWAEELIKPYTERFSMWVSQPGGGAYGIGWLLNDLVNQERELAEEIVSSADPIALGEVFSAITLDSAYGVCGLMDSTGSAGRQDWKAKLIGVLDTERLIGLAPEWTERSEAHRYAELCQSLLWWDEDVAVDMAERFVPAARELLASNPVQGFAVLSHNLAMTVLRAFDPLGIYDGTGAPDKRRRAIARSMCSSLDPTVVARQLAEMRRRDFGAAANFLYFLFKWAPRKFAAVLSEIEWADIGSLIDEEWANLSQEAEVLLGILAATKDGQRSVEELVQANLERIERFPPRLVLVAPEAAVDHLKRGREVRLAQLKRVDWDLGGLAVTVIDELEPGLVHRVFAPFEEDFARALSAPNATFFDDSELLIGLMLGKVPDFAARVLSRVDAEVAERGLVDCLRKRREHQRSAALIVEAAIGGTGPMGAMAQRLRKRFPKASVPPKALEADVP